MIKDQKDSGEVYVMGTLAFEEVKQIVKEEIKKQAHLQNHLLTFGVLQPPALP